MRIHLLSSPRNVSTALMYSFAQRGDMSVIDEPYYALYLKESGAEHPGRERILNAMPTDVEGVTHSIEQAQTNEHIFIKGMAHHLAMVDLSRIEDDRFILFIRDPKKLIASFSKVISKPTMADIGIERQCSLFKQLKEAGKPVVVFDSDDLLSNPENALRQLCKQLSISFDKAMLSWEKGPLKEDGVWAEYWYKNVHNSTKFEAPNQSPRVLNSHGEALLAACLPFYEMLRAQRV